MPTGLLTPDAPLRREVLNDRQSEREVDQNAAKRHCLYKVVTHKPNPSISFHFLGTKSENVKKKKTTETNRKYIIVVACLFNFSRE